MIIVDGRTDQEKLVELLQQPEQTHLEFKSLLDLQEKRDELNFVKDAVAMANRPPGGYILVGVNDDGKKALPIGTIDDRSRFDGARLGDMIRKYVESEIHVISQFHEVDGHEVVVIYLPHSSAGLPVPMSKDGQHTRENGKNEMVFREGDIFVREGAQITPIRYAHWNVLLSHRDQQLRQESRAQVDSMISDLAVALRAAGAGRTAPIPLTVEMANDAFSEAIISQLESDSDIRLRQFSGEAAALISNADQRDTALEKLTILIAQAMYFERDGVANYSLSKLFAAYAKTGDNDAVTLLAVITRIYVLGSLAVRLQRWGVIRDLVLRPYPSASGGYTYSSWIRHGQVAASRNKLFPKDKGGMMISDARKIMSEEPGLRPGVPESVVPSPEDLADDDILLNSLCEFDILYCLIVDTQGQHRGEAYPAASALHQYRSDPAFALVATDIKARGEMFPAISEKEVAQSIKRVFYSAKQQSFNFGGYWSSLPFAAEQFVAERVKYPM